MAYFEQTILSDSEFPCDVFIADNKQKQVSVDLHWHDCFEIMYQLSGESVQTVNGKSIIAKKGDILFVKSGQHHATYCDFKSDAEIFVIKFMPSMIDNYGCLSNSKYMAAFLNWESDIVNLPAEIRQKTESTLKRMLLEYKRNEPGFEMFIKADIYLLIGIFIRAQIISVPVSHSSSLYDFRKVVEFIEKHYNTEICLRDISNKLNMNYTYTSRYFKKITGRTFKQYLDYVRVNEADKMIRLTDKSLAVIALECGFNSQQSFCRTYSRIKGYAPQKNRTKVKKC